MNNSQKVAIEFATERKSIIATCAYLLAKTGTITTRNEIALDIRKTDIDSAGIANMDIIRNIQNATYGSTKAVYKQVDYSIGLPKNGSDI